MIRVTFDINPDGLGSFTDSHLAALWHVSQANPAQHGDCQAGELARAVGVEIVRRWLAETPPELYAHQPSDHYWQTLVRHGAWTGQGGTWETRAAASGSSVALTNVAASRSTSATPSDLVRELSFAANAWTREAADFRNSQSSTPGDECAYLADLLARAAAAMASATTSPAGG
ncbi:hypothetical protein [Sphaerotilus mobilis]|uniref:Uncharacterized protein n=1 Tax=Sphaerotilus mobilis TaxID=47994 RepID=A0A4Q7LAH2_9BURK|nr:hypothetical protein [Sphaerotilus mobilis]RZS47499.1 hypothetical protein EV685_3704 [Sphaerotilus mobilis]